MADLNDAEIDAALARGKIARTNKPRATQARHDRRLGRIVVDLTNGCTFSFPARLAQGLGKVTGDQLASVESPGHGYGLHWELLDTDISILGLMASIFGTKVYMARLAGQARYPAKVGAASQRRKRATTSSGSVRPR